MVIEDIVEVRIDAEGKLVVRPQVSSFPFIYRAAMEVGWDPDNRTLFSPGPRELSYLQWFRQIVAAALDEYGVRLVITPQTAWADAPDALRAEIEAERNQPGF
jgi:Integron Cassette Protein Hfx_Cass5